MRQSKLTRPLLRVPDRPAGDWIYVFDILTVSTPPPGPDPGFVAEMLDRNRRLFEEAQLKENIALARSGHGPRRFQSIWNGQLVPARNK